MMASGHGRDASGNRQNPARSKARKTEARRAAQERAEQESWERRRLAHEQGVSPPGEPAVASPPSGVQVPGKTPKIPTKAEREAEEPAPRKKTRRTARRKKEE